MGRKNNGGSGFTLIELLIVVAVLSLLSVAVIWALRSSLLKGHDARRKADIDRIRIAIEEYEKDHNCYPPPNIMTCNLPPLNGKGLEPYLNLIPCDPVTKSSYLYYYEDNSCPKWFKIYSKLENTGDTSVTEGIGPGSAFNYVSGSANAPGEGIIGGDGSGTTPPPGGGGVSGFYGCRGGVCVPISWDPARPGPECDPNYQDSTCYGQCESQSNECTLWNQPHGVTPFL